MLMPKSLRSAVRLSLPRFAVCALALAFGWFTQVAHAQLPALVPIAGREVFYATGTDNYPAYSGNGYGVGRDAAGDLFFLDSKPEILELPVSGPMQIAVPNGDAAFNCGTAVNTDGFEFTADPQGNLYVGHSYGCSVTTKITRITTPGSTYGTYCTSSSTGCTAEATAFSALYNVSGGYYQAYDIAVDALGNAYVPSKTYGLLMAGPSAPGGATNLVAGGTAKAVAVDGSGNVFYVDGTYVWEIPYTQVTQSTPTPIKLGYYGTGTCPGCQSIPASTTNVFLDQMANVYVVTTATPYVMVIPNSASGYGLTTYAMPATMASHIGANNKGVIDNAGNFFLYNGSSIERYASSISIANSGNDFPALFAASPSSGNTGTLETPSVQLLVTQTTTFNATTPEQVLNTPAANGGAAAAQFTYGGTDTCTGTVNAGSSCTFYLKYAPFVPGAMKGALTIYGAQGSTTGNKVVAVVPMQALATGAAVAVDPGVQSKIGTGYQAPAGVAVDGSGNTFVADPDSNAVYEYPAGSSAAGTAIGTGLSAPSGVAVDASGNVYIADTGNDRVVMVPNEATSTAGVLALNSADQTVVTTTGYELSSPHGVAFDPIGNLYIADTGNARVLAVTPTISGSVNGGVPWVLSLGASGYSFVSPYAVAVDAFQNTYVADPGSNAVYLIPGGFGFTGTQMVNPGPGVPVRLTNSAGTTAFNAPSGVAVDGSGSVYVADTGNAKIVRLPATAGTYSTTPPTASTVGIDMYTKANSGLDKPFGIAVDSTADVYFTDQAAPKVQFVQRSVANGGTGVTALAFGSETVGTPTSAQTATLSNAGLITALSVSALPALTSSSSPFAETATSCSTGTPLTVGSACTFSLTYDPTAAGTTTPGTFSFTDNGLGGSSVTQGFQLTGDGVGAIATLTLSGPTSITYGDTATYTIIAKDSNSNVITLPSGTTYSLSGATCSSPCTLNAGGTFFLPNLTVSASTYTITATVNSMTSSAVSVTVGKAPLYITAGDVSRPFDMVNAALTAPAYSGFANGDSASTVVSASASSSTSVTRTSPTGDYLIVPSGGSLTTFGSTNYTATYVDGDFVVTGSVPQTIFFPALPALPHGSTYVLTGQSTSGLPLIYGVSSGSATISGNVLTVSAAGTVTIEALQPGNSTYAAATPVSVSFTAP